MSIILDALKKSQDSKQKKSAQEESVDRSTPRVSTGIFNPVPEKLVQDVKSADTKKSRVVILGMIVAFGLGFVVINNFAPKIMEMISGQGQYVIKPKAGEYKIDPDQVQKILAQQKAEQLNAKTDKQSDKMTEKQKQEQEKIVALKKEASSYFDEHKYDKAVYVYKQLVNLAPTDHLAYNNFGLALKKMGKLNEAKQSYNTALALKPDYPEALNNIAVIELSERLYTQAKDHLKKAIEVDPEYLDPYLHLAICLEKSGDVEQAEIYYEDFLKKSEGKISRKVRLQIENRLARLQEDM